MDTTVNVERVVENDPASVALGDGGGADRADLDDGDNPSPPLQLTAEPPGCAESRKRRVAQKLKGGGSWDLVQARDTPEIESEVQR